LDEKGKKYGSFNPTSVNSFCPVAGRSRYSPQVGDFDPATGGGFSSGHPGYDGECRKRHIKAEGIAQGAE